LAASAGIAEFTPGDTPTSLIRRADTALYADKRARAAASAAALTPLRANAA
jgi:PleD family two-component response regulator